MRLRHGMILFAVGLAAVACDDLFSVDSPLRVPATELENSLTAPLQVRSVIGDFECAYGNYVNDVATVGDEFKTAATPAQRALDWRLANSLSGGLLTCATLFNTPTIGIYIPLHTARYQAVDVYARLERWVQAGDSIPGGPTAASAFMATVAAYAGYSYTMFGEGFCQCVFDGGAPISWRQSLVIAETWFTRALGHAQDANSPELINFASVGRARVRLDLGLQTEAAADARNVAPGFRRDATFSSDSPRRQNQVHVYSWVAGYVTVDPRYRNLTVGGVPDPRVSVFDAGRTGLDGLTPVWLPFAVASDASPIPLATWDEAQLIIAEAEGGQSAVDHINLLRIKYGLPQYAHSDPDSIRAQVREERRRQLFLQGHRLNDMLRFNLPFDVGPGYGSMTCFRIPNNEINTNTNCAGGQCGATSRAP